MLTIGNFIAILNDENLIIQGENQMKKILYLLIIFENGEIIKIEDSQIENLYMGSITETISRLSPNNISKISTVEEVFMQIKACANNQTVFINKEKDRSNSPFTRIFDQKDISAIDLYYQDGSSDYLFVSWELSTGYHNQCQHSLIHQTTGDLYIAISKTRSLSAFLTNNRNI